MANWAELPRDLLISIARHVRLIEDYAAFGAVCSSWRAVATKENFKGIRLWQQIPCLMLAAEEDDDYREFYSLFEDHVVAKIFLPETKGKKCMEAGFGWLFTIDQEGESSLVNPFTRDQIDLPHQNTTDYFEARYPQIFYHKAVLSSSPCQSPSDFVLMVIRSEPTFLSLWRPGDNQWTKISTPYGTSFTDGVHHKGQFYAIGSGGVVVVCDIAAEESRMVAKFSLYYAKFHMYYIVESLGTLLVVGKYGTSVRQVENRPDEYESYDIAFVSAADPPLIYLTTQFRVFELDVIHNKWTKIQDLGDRALFLGFSVSVCIDQASRFPEIKANHIYFTDNYFDFQLSPDYVGGRDMGVYNLKDGSIIRHFKGQSLSSFGPPIWVMPCSSCMSNHKP